MSENTYRDIDLFTDKICMGNVILTAEEVLISRQIISIVG